MSVVSDKAITNSRHLFALCKSKIDRVASRTTYDFLSFPTLFDYLPQNPARVVFIITFLLILSCAPFVGILRWMGGQGSRMLCHVQDIYLQGYKRTGLNEFNYGSLSSPIHINLLASLRIVFSSYNEDPELRHSKYKCSIQNRNRSELIRWLTQDRSAKVQAHKVVTIKALTLDLVSFRYSRLQKKVETRLAVKCGRK